MAVAACWLVLLLVVPPPSMRTAVVEADRDSTLIEHPDGALANGSGPSLFVGRTGQSTGGLRRSVVRFDLSGLPPKAKILDVRLRLYVAPSNPGLNEVRAHRVLADWGEGASTSSGGSGVPAAAGDATWVHAFHDTGFWMHNGGQFEGTPSSSAPVGDSGFYEWSTPAMADDVRGWLARPDLNFGWILIGDETAPQTVKRLSSREDPDTALRPVLEIDYRPPAAVPAGRGR